MLGGGGGMERRIIWSSTFGLRIIKWQFFEHFSSFLTQHQCDFCVLFEKEKIIIALLIVRFARNSVFTLNYRRKIDPYDIITNT